MRVSIYLDQPPTNAPTDSPTYGPEPPSHRFRIKSDLGEYCIVPETLTNDAELKIVTCTGEEKEYWGADAFGQISNSAKAGKCMERTNQKVRLQKCKDNSPPPEKQQFGFNINDKTFFHKGDSALVFHLLTTLVPENQEVKLAARQFNADFAFGQKWSLSH
jgi:hypothetical protein